MDFEQFRDVRSLLTSHSRLSRRKSSSLSNFDFCSGTTRGILKKNRGFGCSYNPIESYGIIPANASFIILIDLFFMSPYFLQQLHLEISNLLFFSKSEIHLFFLFRRKEIHLFQYSHRFVCSKFRFIFFLFNTKCYLQLQRKTKQNNNQLVHSDRSLALTAKPKLIVCHSELGWDTLCCINTQANSNSSSSSSSSFDDCSSHTHTHSLSLVRMFGMHALLPIPPLRYDRFM